MRVKEIDDPRSTHPATARSTIRPGTPRHASHLLGIVCGVRALRRVRGECREGHGDHIPGLDSHNDERRDDHRSADDDVSDHDDDSQDRNDDRTDDGDHGTTERDDDTPNRDHGEVDADHRAKGRAEFRPGHAPPGARRGGRSG